MVSERATKGSNGCTVSIQKPRLLSRPLPDPDHLSKHNPLYIPESSCWTTAIDV